MDRITREDIDHVIQVVLNLSGFSTGGLQMTFFGETNHLKGILKSEIPDRPIEVFDSDALLNEVNIR
jgi:hypothetical protein